jgi:thioesterase domain-containing protein
MARHLELQGQSLALLGLVDTVPDFERKGEEQDDIAALRDWLRDQDVTDVEQSRLLETTSKVILSHRRLLHSHSLPHFQSRLGLWWAGDTRSAQSQADHGWRTYAAKGVRVLGTLKATHTSIVHHPAFHLAVREIVSAPHPDAS